MEFVKINQQNFVDINKANQPFEIIGKIKPAFANGIWTYTEEIYEQPYMKAYPNDTWDYGTYINNPDKTIFFAYSGAECVGQIILKKIGINTLLSRIFALQNRPEGKELAQV